MPGLWEQGCQPEGLLCALILPGPLPWQERPPGKTTRRNQWGFSGKATYFLAGLMPGQQGSLPLDPPQGFHHTDTVLGTRRQKRV